MITINTLQSKQINRTAIGIDPIKLVTHRGEIGPTGEAWTGSLNWEGTMENGEFWNR